MRTVHVVGAGLAGLAAAERVAAAGVRTVVWEAAPQAGGRCRSYFDDALGLTIDNGNHLVLSGNTAALAYVHRIGGEAALTVGEARFPFVDLASGKRWVLAPGRSPAWLFDPARRVPGTRPLDYLAPLRLLASRRRTRVADRLAGGRLYERLWRPLLLAALNTDLAEASARMAARVVAQTLGRGAAACRPVIATGGLGAAFVEPALGRLAALGAEVRLGTPVRALRAEGGRALALVGAAGETALGPADRAILAVPAQVAATLLPGLAVPTRFSPIVNVHFAATAELPPLTGLVGGLSEWLFAFPDRLSVTISAADRLSGTPREEIAREVWAEVATIAGLGPELPRWQVIRERRATFAATPEELARRPRPATALANVVLAGDWTATGLPATIEGAVRSGVTAAALALAPLRPRSSLAAGRSLRRRALCRAGSADARSPDLL